MSDLTLLGDKRMTVREVAMVLGVDPEAIKKHVRELFPDLMRNGIVTYLTEAEVTAIKGRMIPTTQVVGAQTELEIASMTATILGYWKAKADELAAKVATDAPKIEGFDALMRSDKQLSITDCAKHFGLHPRFEVFPYLRAMHYLTGEGLPTQAAIDAGYLSLKVTTSQTGQVYQQAVVEAWQLENWRSHVVHQIKRWISETR